MNTAPKARHLAILTSLAFTPTKNPTIDLVVSLATYITLRLDAANLMNAAGKLPGLPQLYRAQADAIAKLCTLKLYQVHLTPDSQDACAVRDDVETLAVIFDALFDSVGKEAAANFHGINGEAFRGKVATALDEAVHELTHAAERLDEDLQQTEHDARRPGTRRAARE